MSTTRSSWPSPSTSVTVRRRWRRRLVQIVDVLTNQVSGGAYRRRAGLPDRVTAADAFDHLLDKFAEARHHSRDQFLIPAELARLMVRIADPGPADHVCDPCCGSGELLVAAMEHMKVGAGRLPASGASGRAMNRRTWRLAAMNIAVHGHRAHLGDGPREDPREIDAGAGRYDVIVTNPPFNMADWRLAPIGRQRPWPFGEPPQHNANFAWLQVVVEALDRDGRAVVAMPAIATATHNSRERRIRNAMVDSGVVRCVVALPGHLFRETTAAVTLWVLGCPDDASPTDILLVDARAAVRADHPTHRVLTDAGCDTIVDFYRGWVARTTTFPVAAHDVVATRATVDQVRHHDYDLHPAAYRSPAGAPADRPAATLPELREDLRRLHVEAEAADRALTHRLDRLRPWRR
jgi:type I restriction enzyme M protein